MTLREVSRHELSGALRSTDLDIADELLNVLDFPGTPEVFLSAAQSAQSLMVSLPIKYAIAAENGRVLVGADLALVRLSALGSASIRLLAVDASPAFYSVFLADDDGSVVGVVKVSSSDETERAR